MKHFFKRCFLKVAEVKTLLNKIFCHDLRMKRNSQNEIIKSTKKRERKANENAKKRKNVREHIIYV
jgi:hypothetical protein